MKKMSENYILKEFKTNRPKGYFVTLYANIITPNNTTEQ